MAIAAFIALGVLVTVLLVNAPPANPQPLPPTPVTTQDCNCGVPDSPRGPR